MKIPSLLLALALSAVSAFAAEPNTLTAEEKAAGWKLLFDGKTVEGWASIDKETFPAQGWVVKDDALVRMKGGGDIVTTEHFENFELTWEWKMAKSGGNSGLKYNLPDPKKNVGFEYQMLGLEVRKGGQDETACLYSILPVAAGTPASPAGEWISSRVLVQGSHVEHWLNEVKALEFERGSDALKEAIAKSKFKSTPNFGEKLKSPIMLQDHGSEVAVRSIKIRPITLPE